VSLNFEGNGHSDERSEEESYSTFIDVSMRSTKLNKNISIV